MPGWRSPTSSRRRHGTATRARSGREHADRYDRAGRRHWQRFLDADLIAPDDAVLDVGCGTGKSTRDAARITSQGSVLGVDLSATMLGRAREQAEAAGLTNVTYVQGDAQVHPFEAERVRPRHEQLRRHVLRLTRWPRSPTSVAASAPAGVSRCSPGASSTATSGSWRCAARWPWAATSPMPPPDAPTPFSLADPDRVRGILGAAGFEDVGVRADRRAHRVRLRRRRCLGVRPRRWASSRA